MDVEQANKRPRRIRQCLPKNFAKRAYQDDSGDGIPKGRAQRSPFYRTFTYISPRDPDTMLILEVRNDSTALTGAFKKSYEEFCRGNIPYKNGGIFCIGARKLNVEGEPEKGIAMTEDDGELVFSDSEGLHDALMIAARDHADRWNRTEGGIDRRGMRQTTDTTIPLRTICMASGGKGNQLKLTDLIVQISDFPVIADLQSDEVVEMTTSDLWVYLKCHKYTPDGKKMRSTSGAYFPLESFLEFIQQPEFKQIVQDTSEHLDSLTGENTQTYKYFEPGTKPEEVVKCMNEILAAETRASDNAKKSAKSKAVAKKYQTRARARRGAGAAAGAPASDLTNLG